MTRVLVIIDAAHLPSARALLQSPPFSHTPEQAEQSFVRADAGDTKYWLSGNMTDATRDACLQLCAALAWADCYTYDLETEPDFPEQRLVAMGLQPYAPSIP